MCGGHPSSYRTYTLSPAPPLFRSLPANTVQERIDYMKAHPGELNHGSPGLASSSHVSVELFKLRAGVQAQHVPYKGSSPMLADLMGGAIDFTIDNISSSLELIKSKKLHAIAVTSRNRSPLLPELPTMIESGMPGYVMEIGRASCRERVCQYV